MLKPDVMLNVRQLTFFSQILIILVILIILMGSQKFENSHSESSQQWFSEEGLTDKAASKF